MARLIDCPLSVGLATFDKMVRQSDFTDALGEAIRKDPARAIAALNSEFFQTHPYRGNGPGKSAAVEVTSLIPADGWAAEYARFCQEVLGLTVDFSGIEIPAEQPGFGWVVIVPEGMTLNHAWTKCKERFPSYSYLGDDLNKEVPKNDRTPTKAYAKRFRDRVEADEENKNLSANTLAKRKVQSITLLERILLELWYHWKTDGHLDIENVTLCAGSRDSGGDAPYAGWHDGGFRVYYYYPDDASGALRSRSAV